jgi:hypothetical protein
VIKFKSKGLKMGRIRLKITPKEPLIFFENVILETKGFPQKKRKIDTTLVQSSKPAIMLEYEIIHEVLKLEVRAHK